MNNLINFLNQNGYKPSNEVFENGYLLENRIYKLEDLNIEYKLVDRYGGEGEGDRHWFVLYFPESNTFLRARGYYQSYDGSDYSSSKWEEVIPKEKTITVYEPISKTSN